MKRTTADAYSLPVSIAKRSIVIIPDTPVPLARMSPAGSAERCTVQHIPSTPAPEIWTRIILYCIASIAKRSINQLKHIPADACIRPVRIAEHGIAITLDTPVPDVLTKRAENVMRCTVRSIRHTIAREHKS